MEFVKFVKGFKTVRELIDFFADVVAKKNAVEYFEALRTYKLEGNINHRDIHLEEFFGVEDGNDLYTFTTKYNMFMSEKFYNMQQWVEAVSDKWKVSKQTRYYRDGEEGDVTETKIKIGPTEEVECVYDCARYFEAIDDSGKKFMIEVEEKDANMKLFLSIKIYALKEDREFITKVVVPSLDRALSSNIFKNKVVAIGNGFEFLEPVTLQYVIPDKLAIEAENISDIVRSLDRLKKLELKTSSGIILHGEPGTGKTSFIRHIIGDLYGEATMFVVTAKGFNVGTLVGVYELARELAPSIVLFEDLDLIAKDRDSGQFMGIMNELLNLLDGHVQNVGVVTIATTNYIAEIDKALTNRPGRFERKVEVSYPTIEERKAIFCAYLGDSLNSLPKNFVNDLAHQVDNNFTNDHLREIVAQAKLLSFRENRDQEAIVIEERHLEEAFKIVTHQSLKKNATKMGYVKKG